MARPKKRAGPHVYWRNDRAYGDFRSRSDVGGGREAPAEPGKQWGTTDPKIASVLFEKRLAKLNGLRQALAPGQLGGLLEDLRPRKRGCPGSGRVAGAAYA